MNVHWLIYTLRGWLAFVAFMNVGTAFRCFLDENFLTTKLFSMITVPIHPIASRIFGAYSIQQAVLLVHCAFHIHDYSVYRITITSLFFNLIGFLCEGIFYGSSHIAGYILFPFSVLVITIIWLMVAFPYIWCPDSSDELEENHFILKKRSKSSSAVKKIR